VPLQIAVFEDEGETVGQRWEAMPAFGPSSAPVIELGCGD
jgi:hypothetical protein